MQIVVLGESSSNDEMRGGWIEKQALYDANFTRLLRKVDVCTKLVYQGVPVL